MKKAIIFLALLCCGALSACFKDEPLNAECDIEQAFIHTEQPEKMFFSANDTLRDVLYTEDNINFNVRTGTDLTALAPQFRITEGATIDPKSGSVHDFSAGPVSYKVTSEDGQWSRTYNVSFTIVTRTVSDTLKFDFESYDYNSDAKKYFVWSEPDIEGFSSDMWATGNAGFAISRSSAKPMEYPTTPLADGYDGHAVQLTTRSTGAFGAMKDMRLAAGNLFIGRFDATKALLPGGAMQATQFGLPTDRKPVKLTGYYQYTPGTTYQDVKGKEVAGKTDEGTIYAVFYRNEDAAGNSLVLHGDDVQTNAMVIGKAILPKVETTSVWTPFEVEFIYTEDVDEALLMNRGYSLAVVFSSSTNGASFEGAIGSTLLVDKVRVICEKTE